MKIKMNDEQIVALKRALNYASNSHKAEILSAIAEGNFNGATRINCMIDKISYMREMIFAPDGVNITAYQAELLISELHYAIRVRSAEADEEEKEGNIEYARFARQAVEGYMSLSNAICGGFPGVWKT